MLYQIPSGSKSSGSGVATGWLAWNPLRLAISDQVPPGPTLITPLGTEGTPCAQPAPASSAYSWLPMKATLDTPSTTLPAVGAVLVVGSALTPVATTPLGLTLEIRPPATRSLALPLYG